MVHAVDLGTGVTFAELPADFLRELGHDIVGKRRSAPLADFPEVRLAPDDTDPVVWSLPGTEPGPPIVVAGPLADVTAYLAGRGHAQLRATRDGHPTPIPSLPAWL